MIAYLCGMIADVYEDSVVIDVNGIGYEVKVTGNTAVLLAREAGKVKLHTYMQVREDGISLFGFLSRDDLNVFKQLLGVNGVGPKGALGILSALSPDELRFAVFSSDAKAISRAPGIGAKTAQRIILDLKDKLKMEDVFEHMGEPAAPVMDSAGAASARSEAIQALVALGYSNADAVTAVKKVGDVSDMDTEDILKNALKYMAF